jgi:hypothetical protein
MIDRRVTALLSHLIKKKEALEGEGKKKFKAIPVTGHRGPYGYETSRLPHFLDSRLTDGDEVVSLTHRPPFTPSRIPGTHFR